jgi:hypothetical protein
VPRHPPGHLHCRTPTLKNRLPPQLSQTLDFTPENIVLPLNPTALPTCFIEIT